MDREKIIEWAEKCTSSVHESEDCNRCPYHLEHEGFYSCIECLLMDIVALLKEREAMIKPTKCPCGELFDAKDSSFALNEE